MNIVIGNFLDQRIEMAERKGMGHPDTICDEITEQISSALCRYYLNECGTILHHNVDKALLIGGQSSPAYLGGKISEPITLIIAGRATHKVGTKEIPVDDIAMETAKKWLIDHIRHLNVNRDVEIHSRIRPGSVDLIQLFNRLEKGEVALANDTSFGAGYFPYTSLDQMIVKIEQLLNSSHIKKGYPFIGEDIKVMGCRTHEATQYTIAIAMIDQYIHNLEDYIDKKEAIKSLLNQELKIGKSDISINSADSYEQESVYLTVSGTSAESGDDGQVGRGNRINGLITPYHPMSLEAASGKNPVSHVGKIYNYFAYDLARDLVKKGFANNAQVYMVSQIGRPITEPAAMHIRLDNQSAPHHQKIKNFIHAKLPELANYWTKILARQPWKYDFQDE